jgi:hypothetical protein
MEDFNKDKYNYEREIDFINLFKNPLEENIMNNDVNVIINYLIACHKNLIEKLKVYKTQDDFYFYLSKFFIMIFDYFPKISKNNRIDIKYFQNTNIKNINTYILSMLYINSGNITLTYEEKRMIGGGYDTINIADYYEYISTKIKKEKNKKLILLEQYLRKYINKLNDTSNLFLINYVMENIYNLKKYNYKNNYNITDFILSFILYYTNINDFNLTNSEIANLSTIKHLTKFHNDRYNIETENGLIHNLYNLIETGKFNCIFDYPDNFILTYNILFKGKHIIYHKKMQETSKETDLVLLNFLALFEKQIDKLLLQNKIIYKNNFKEKINIIHKKEFNAKRFYDFKYFCELLYNILNNNENSLKSNIIEFVENVRDLLINNDKTHIFSINYHSKICKEPCIEVYDKYYNINYINFKKPLQFVKELNDIVNYYCKYFYNITDSDFLENTHIHHHFIRYIKKPVLVYYNSTKKDYVYSYTDTGYMIRHVLFKFKKNNYFTEDNNEDYFPNILRPKPKELMSNCFLCDIEIYFDENTNYENIKKIFIEYFKQYCMCFDKLNNLYIYLNLFVNQEAHACSIIINFDNHYIDLFNPWSHKIKRKYENEYNHRMDLTRTDKYEILFTYIIKFFETDFKNYIIPALNEYYSDIIKDYKPLNCNEFDIYKYTDNALFQATYENKKNGFCAVFNILYALIRLKYFNDGNISMNYVQEMICEYIISINHYLYVFQILDFVIFTIVLDLLNLYNSYDNLIAFVKDDKSSDNYKLEFNIGYLNKDNDPLISMYQSFCLNYDKAMKNVRNIKRIFNIDKNQLQNTDYQNFNIKFNENQKNKENMLIKYKTKRSSNLLHDTSDGYERDIQGVNVDSLSNQERFNIIINLIDNINKINEIFDKHIKCENTNNFVFLNMNLKCVTNLKVLLEMKAILDPNKKH